LSIQSCIIQPSSVSSFIGGRLITPSSIGKDCSLDILAEDLLSLYLFFKKRWFLSRNFLCWLVKKPK